MALSPNSRAALLKFADREKIPHSQGFKNFTRNVSVPDALVLKVDSVDKLQKLMKFATELRKSTPEEKMTVRTAAGGRNFSYSHSYSLSPCAAAPVVIHLTDPGFTGIKVTDAKEHIVEVGASMTMGELDEQLAKLKPPLNLPTSSLIPYITVGGATANSVHNMGRKQPSFGGLIKSMTFCTTQGDLVKVDAQHIRRLLPSGATEIIGESGPELFDTLRGGHLGAFGHLVKTEIHCAPAQKLQCVREARSLNDVIEDIRRGMFHDNDHTSIMYIPTSQGNAEENYVNTVTTRYKEVPLTAETTDNFHPNWDEFQQSIEIGLNNLVDLPHLIATFPTLGPLFSRFVVAPLQVGSRDTITVGDWAPSMHYRTAYPWNIDNIDFLIPTRGRGCPEVVKALEIFKRILKKYEDQKIHPISNAVYLRFFKGFNGGLSTSEHGDDEWICGFDIVSGPDTEGFQDFKRELEAAFRTELRGVKVHWGKSFSEDVNFADMYPEQLPRFRRSLEKWYKVVGGSPEILENAFLHRVLTAVPSAQLKDRKAEDFKHASAAAGLSSMPVGESKTGGAPSAKPAFARTPVISANYVKHAEKILAEINRQNFTAHPDLHLLKEALEKITGPRFKFPRSELRFIGRKVTVDTKKEGAKVTVESKLG